MKKIFFLFLLFVTPCFSAQNYEENLEQNSSAVIRNYQSVNQCTHVINAHKQALIDSTAAIYANIQALQKCQTLLQDHQKLIKETSNVFENNAKSVELSTLAIASHGESIQEARKILHLFKHFPWVLMILFLLFLLPSLIMLWAFFNLKKTLKK